MRMILSAWFDHDHLEEVQFKKFCLPVKTSCPPAENVNETPAKCDKFLGGPAELQ